VNFNEYQTLAKSTDLFVGGSKDFTSPAFLSKVLGLVGETGEVADKCKKILRDKGGVATDADVEELKKEIGDVLWYVATVARYLGLDLEDVAQANLKKLEDRHARNVISGSGDNR
jgi:NTP pyrophosphatase (non-canonical NTP hydrolase)